jgi:hypothetical protein
MQKDKALLIVKSFVDEQAILDTSMTLAELSRKLGDRWGEVAGYTFAWEKYVYDIASIGDDAIKPLPKAVRAERLIKANEVLNLNIKIGELMQQARDRKLDEVAGYVYTEDKFTIIVAIEAELEIRTK